MNNLAEHKNSNGDTPDLIAMGGGTWDKLHVYSTDENRKSHANTLKALSAEMKKSQDLGIPIVWIIPTTINNPNLNTEGRYIMSSIAILYFIVLLKCFCSLQSSEKRDHMTEEDMEAMRAGKFSIHAIIAFILSGTTITHLILCFLPNSLRSQWHSFFRVICD